MKKILITGSNGLLGQKLVKLFLSKDNFEIHAISKGENRIFHKEGYRYHNLDLTCRKSLEVLVNEIRPDYIVHTAAMTNVDACEKEKEICNLINVEVVVSLVDLCKNLEIYLIHLSTDFIFDGFKEGLYTEEDKPNPLSNYGMSKLRSEEVIISSSIRYAILRTVLVYGMVDGNDRSNIVLWVKKSLEDKKSINVVTDQYRMPTYAEDLAEACWLCIVNDAIGVFNVSSNQLLSVYEIALEICRTFGLDKSYISPIESSTLNLPAKRPFKTPFDLKKSISKLNLPSYSFSERLQVFKNQLAKYESGL